MLTNNNKLESESVFPRLPLIYLDTVFFQEGREPRASKNEFTLAYQHDNIRGEKRVKGALNSGGHYWWWSDLFFPFTRLLRSSCPEGVSRSACKHVMIGSDFDQLPFLSSSLILDYSTVLLGPHRIVRLAQQFYSCSIFNLAKRFSIVIESRTRDWKLHFPLAWYIPTSKFKNDEQVFFSLSTDVRYA